jgi:hypothetical protein
MSAIAIDNDNSTIEFQGFTYLFISPNRKLKIDRTAEHAAIIIEGKDLDFVRLVVKRIRSSFQSGIFLKPILLLNGNSHRDSYIRELTDGMIYSFDQLDLVQQHVHQINERINEIKFINSLSIEAQIITKLLAFMYSRGSSELEPIPSIHSNTNYTFPFLATHFDFKEEHKIFEILEIARQEALFVGEFFDRVYFCSNCKSSHLSIREVCPKCNSSNSETYDIVHHFPCAYVGPINDFGNELDDQLSCPKCSKRLRHIGVDYDKPSVLHHCKKCLNSYQDYFVQARCMSCSYDNPVESLIPTEINNYRITKKGEYAAVNGFVSTPRDIEEIIGTVKYDTFKTMCKYEIERIRQTDGSSNIVGINIVNSSKVYSKIGSKAQQELLRDIVASVRASIRSSDMITFHSASIILISLNEIPTKIAERLTQDILKIISTLLDNNFKDFNVELNSVVRKLNYQLTADLQIDQMLNAFAE